jgi:hypothetical protein
LSKEKSLLEGQNGQNKKEKERQTIVPTLNKTF